MKTTRLLLPLAALLLAPVAARADAADAWKHNCASCHGPDGAGHTKAGRMAQTKDFTSAEYQAKFSDEEAAKRIAEGLKSPEGKERMKAFGDKFSAAEIKDLVTLVRSYRK